jgi:hypothetical protein
LPTGAEGVSAVFACLLFVHSGRAALALDAGNASEKSLRGRAKIGAAPAAKLHEGDTFSLVCPGHLIIPRACR